MKIEDIESIKPVRNRKPSFRMKALEDMKVLKIND